MSCHLHTPPPHRAGYPWSTVKSARHWSMWKESKTSMLSSALSATRPQ
jgi:hypothetical protein